MIPFRAHQIVIGIPTEAGFEKLNGLRQREMHLVHRTSFDRYINRSALQHMTASFSIRGQEVEVVSGDSKRARKPGRPKANERALLIFETEFFLSRRRNFEASTLSDRFHNPDPH